MAVSAASARALWPSRVVSTYAESCGARCSLITIVKNLKKEKQSSYMAYEKMLVHLIFPDAKLDLNDAAIGEFYSILHLLGE